MLPSGTPPRPHDHWDLILDSGQVLRFHDPRRFGSLHWVVGDALAHPLLAKLGPEPLSTDFDAEYLHRATRKRSVAIKHLIMNSQIVVGVGNIYASEALFRARISPRRASQANHAGGVEGVGARYQRSAIRGHRDRRHDVARLRQRRGHTRLLRAAALRLRAVETAVPDLQVADQAIHAGSALDLLVRCLPALAIEFAAGHENKMPPPWARNEIALPSSPPAKSAGIPVVSITTRPQGMANWLRVLGRPQPIRRARRGGDCQR